MFQREFRNDSNVCDENATHPELNKLDVQNVLENFHHNFNIVWIS